MKNTLQPLLRSIYLIGMVLWIASCENDDLVPEFTVQAPSENVSFTSSVSDQYLLSEQTTDNIAERFVWSVTDFGVPTAVSYRLEGSLTGTFDEIAYESGTLTETNHAITVGKLMELAMALGLDDDPTTTNEDGSANNSGQVFFRVIAFAGSGEGQTTASSTSDTVALNISLVEAATEEPGSGGIEKASWGVVGSAANDWGGAGPDLPFYTTVEANVFVAYVNLKDGEFKFRENNDWGNNLGDTDADGTLEADGDNIIATAGDYKITLNLNDNTYTIEAFSWGIVGSAWNDWGGAGPDAKMFYDYKTDSFKVGIKLMDGEFKIRFNNDWGTNFGDTGADGSIEQDGDNIVATAGFYLITANFNTMAFSVEPAELWGVVGSGYNDWGGAGPDFTFTEYSEGLWVAENVPLIDGEIKFRLNEDWSLTNYGDAGADGILDTDDGNNIPVIAGTYDIFLDFSDPGAPTYTLILK